MEKKNSVQNLIQHLKNTYSVSSSLDKSMNLNEEEMKKKMRKYYRRPWKSSGIFHEGYEVNRLPISDLDNWEILRINMSKRSYQHKKQYKGMKIPSIGREFSKYTDRDKNGKMPYLYQSDIPKIERLRQKIYTKNFKRTNTVRHDLFGFPSKAHRSDRKPHSLMTLSKLDKLNQ